MQELFQFERIGSPDGKTVFCRDLLKADCRREGNRRQIVRLDFSGNGVQREVSRWVSIFFPNPWLRRVGATVQEISIFHSLPPPFQSSRTVPMGTSSISKM